MNSTVISFANSSGVTTLIFSSLIRYLLRTGVRSAVMVDGSHRTSVLHSLLSCLHFRSFIRSTPRASRAFLDATKEPSLVGSSSSVMRASFTCLKIGRNIFGDGKSLALMGNVSSKETVNSLISFSSCKLETTNSAVSFIRILFQGSLVGTLSRARVVRYGPCIRKPRSVRFSVGK